MPAPIIGTLRGIAFVSCQRPRVVSDQRGTTMSLSDIIAETQAGNTTWREVQLSPTTQPIDRYQSRSYEATYGNKTIRITKLKQSPEWLPSNPGALPLPNLYELKIDGIKTPSDQAEELFNCVDGQRI